MTVHTRVAKPLVEALRKSLTGLALPGETKDFTAEGEREAAEFLAGVAGRRRVAWWRHPAPATPRVRSGSPETSTPPIPPPFTPGMTDPERGRHLTS